jgi:hypothetical protein
MNLLSEEQNKFHPFICARQIYLEDLSVCLAAILKVNKFLKYIIKFSGLNEFAMPSSISQTAFFVSC